jgi:hypothetical protein
VGHYNGRNRAKSLFGLWILLVATHREVLVYLIVSSIGGGGVISTVLTKTAGNLNHREKPHQSMHERRRRAANRLPTRPKKKENKNYQALNQVRKRRGGCTCL